MTKFDLRPVIKAWLIQNHGIAVDEVLSYEEENYSSGYCETCYYEEVRVNIEYLEGGLRRSYTHYGSFGDLIKELESVDIE